MKKAGTRRVGEMPTDWLVQEIYLNILLIRPQVLPSDELGPPESITQISQLPDRSEANAIWLPSGDHVSAASILGSLVIWVAVPPDAGITQISRFPLRSEGNAR